MSRWGDLIRALDGLDAKGPCAARVAELLGFAAPEVPAATPDPLPSPTSPTTVSGNDSTLVGARVLQRPPRAEPEIGRVRVHVQDNMAAPRPDWAAAVLPHVSQGAFEPQLDPLLSPRTARGVLIAALATPQPSNEIDVHRLIDRASRCLPIVEIPYDTQVTLHRSITVLLDRGPALTGFRQDQDLLLSQLRAVVRTADLDVLRFSRLPNPTLVQAGSAVVVVSDLGALSPAEGRIDLEQDWLRTLQRLAARGCPTVALVPMARHRVCSDLLRALPVLTWDESLTATRVRALVGRGLRVPRGPYSGDAT